MRMSISCAVRDMRLANSAAFSAVEGTAENDKYSSIPCRP